MAKYKMKHKPRKSQLKSVQKYEGERIEHKVERMLANKEPIKDSLPPIFTERKEGVLPAYNIRTDRWELATEGMDLITKNKLAQRDNNPAELGATKEEVKEQINTDSKTT